MLRFITTTTAIAAVLLLLLSSCQNEKTETTLDQQLEETLKTVAKDGSGKPFFQLPESHEFAAIPQDPRNPLNNFKVALGKLLFHETAIGSAPKVGLGKTTYSCASCHHAAAGFQACLAQGIGEGGVGFGSVGEKRTPNVLYPADSIDVQPIRSPSAMNGAFQEITLWNGQFGSSGMNLGTEMSWTPGTPKFTNHLGFRGLETQAIAGQNVHRLKIDPTWVKSMPVYKFLFDNAFPDVPEDKRYSRETGGLAIAAYERTLLANRSPWQLWLRGDASAMTEQEKEGAMLFFGKANCGSCHTGPALNSMAFYGYGMGNLTNGNYGAINITVGKPEHKGRGGFTGKPEDMFKFKVPQLYNLKDSPFYGHGATFNSIRQVVEYKNKGIAQNPDVPTSQLASQFVPLNLTPAEVDAISVFLENACRDPFLIRYVPDNLPSNFCFPNNDAQAKIDQGCN